MNTILTYSIVSIMMHAELLWNPLVTTAYDNGMCVTVDEVAPIINQLGIGKAAGCDSLCSESLKHADGRLYILLSMLFTVVFSHGIVPDTIIIPIVKNKCGDVTDKNNYRPIATANVLSKCLELFISSKAFDRVNHWTLFSKLINKGVPLYIVRLLCMWYRRQHMQAKWGCSITPPFCVSNGCKQGGINPCVI